jgi:pyridoxamine 5'-phosphate oxidase
MQSAELYQEAIATFLTLQAEAGAAGEREPTATTLATADMCGRPSARIVLLKQVDAHGFVFFTNYESAKAAQLGVNRQAALCVLWKHLRDAVQVRVEGEVELTSPEESDAYFATRPRASQIGAWASRQSQTLAARGELDARVAETAARFAGAEVPRPPHWGGYRLKPEMIEFWYGQRARLHDRVRYELVDKRWTKRMLYP